MVSKNIINKHEKEKFYLKGNIISIFPTNDQKEIILKYMKLSRMIYNWGIETQESLYKSFINNNRTGIRIYHESELLMLLKDTIKSNPKYYCLKELPWHIASITISHVIDAYEKFFDDRFRNGHPRFKNSNFYYMRFGFRNDNCYIIDGKLKVEGFKHGDFIDIKTHMFDGFGRSSKGYISDKKILMYQPTISFDGDNFHFSFSYFKEKEYFTIPKTEVIGIDLGNRNTFTLSTGEVFHQPDCSSEEKIISSLDRRINEMNLNRIKKMNELGIYIPKNTIQLKLEKRRREKYRDIHNKKFYFYHNITTNIVRRNPTAICIEKIGVEDMQKEYPYLKDIIAETYYFNIRKMFEYKCNKHGILLLEANENYPSSKICSNCGFKYDKLGSKHTFKCPYCKCIIDRDLNASINLRDLYDQYIKGDFSNISFDWINGIGF